MTGGRLSLAPEDGLLGTHAIDAVPGFSLRESVIIGSSHNNLQVLQCQISEFLVYLFADPLVPVHDRSSILHPQSLHLPMIAAGRSACLPGGRSELPTLSPWQLFQAKYLRHSCMYLPTSVLHPCCRLRLHDCLRGQDSQWQQTVSGCLGSD